MSIDDDAEREGIALKRSFKSGRSKSKQASLKAVPQHMRQTKFVMPKTPKWLKALLSGR